MSRLFFFASVFLLLSACSPGESNPYYQKSMAAYYGVEAQARIDARAQTLADEREYTRLRQTQDASGVMAAAALVQIEQTAVIVEQTRIAPTQAIQFIYLTQVAEHTQAALAAPQVTAAAAVAQADTKLEELRVQREEHRLVRDTVIMYAGGATIILLALALSISTVLYSRQQVRSQEIQSYVIESRSGPVVFNRARWLHELLPAPRRQELTHLRQAPAMLEVHSSYAVSSPDSKLDKSMDLVRELFERAIEMEGEEGRRIPSWREMKITSDKWQRAKNLAESLGLVVSQPGVGTTIAEPYADLAEVDYALDMRMVGLSPAPPRDEQGPDDRHAHAQPARTRTLR
jgi:hypothetical protein